MVDGKSFRESMREERKKLGRMTFREKRQHIWEYYKLPIIVAAVVMVLLGSIVNRIINPPKEDFLYVAWLGAQIDPALLTELGERLEPAVDNPERQQVTVITYAATADHALNAAMQTRLAARVRVGDVDIMMSTRAGIFELNEAGGWLRPADDVLHALRISDPPLYERLDLYVIEGKPMGIRLAGSPLLESLGIDTGDLFLAVVSNTQRVDNIALALRELFK
ncbi:MAG: hypothetical protein FWD90_12350 [Defluviitaleaceae bacterium]|nr:hypothetical protein [Defluviitaleaceae bacterium]